MRPPKAAHTAPPELPRPADEPGPGGAPAGLIVVVSLVLLAVGLLATVVERRELGRVMGEADEQIFVRANQALGQALEEKRERALASVGLLVDETRVRATVVTPNFDEATVSDVLEDLRAASGATVLAVLNVAGKVQARSGADDLQQLDLGSVKAVKAALERPTAAVWTLPERVLVMAVAPIRSGAGVAALLMIGFELGSATLAAIERLDGVMGAVVIGDRVVATSSAQPAAVAGFEAARGLAEAGGVVAAPGGELLVRSVRTGESALAGRVVWALPRQMGQARLRGLPTLAWAPAVLVGMMLVLVAVSVRRR